MRWQLRGDIVATARAMNDSGLNQGTSGNIGVRVDGGHFLITPSGVPYHEMQGSDVVELALDGTRVTGGKHPPSTEWRMHAGIFAARPDIDVVLHAHSMYATALSCHRRGIPAFHYMVAKAGGHDIRCAPYATFGTAELAAHAVAALDGRRACLLSNHGMLAIGSTLDGAFALAREVENLAEQYLHALTLGEPVHLDAGEMDRVLERFKTYGKPDRVTSLRVLERPAAPPRPGRSGNTR